MKGPCGYLVAGDLPNWIGAIGTLAAFGLAVLIYWGNSRDRRRAQARLVSAYNYQRPAELALGAFVPAANETPGGGRQIDDTVKYAYVPAETAGLPQRVQVLNTCYAFRWTISNLSDEMVADVETFLVSAHAVIPMSPACPVMPVFAAGTTEDSIYVSADPRIESELQIRVRFTDAVGRRWERTSGHPLKRVRGRRPSVHMGKP